MAGVLSAEMLQGLDVKTYPAGTRIYSKGEKAAHAYLVVKGSVALVTANTDGKNTSLGQIPPGRIFGETAMITGGKRNSHAIAVVETVCAEVDEALIASRLAKVDPFMRYWVEFMSERLAELYGRMSTGGTGVPENGASTGESKP